MPGLYLHIPFCKKACHYCNFHFSTTLRSKGAMVEALTAELGLQREFLGGAPLSSVYFGGGTPSLLEIKELQTIFEEIFRLHPVMSDAEITLEANPDDLSREKIQDLRNYTPVNRLSIGIQSFADADLTWMNRAHHARHARACLDDVLSAGFQDITIDLIYGAPTTSEAQWKENLRIAFEYGIPHLSCYCLTVEEGTALGAFVRKGSQPPVDEDRAARQFEYLVEATAERGYEHYEISNFAKPGRYARHNSSYWNGEPYLGIGPSAHSFNGVSRQWNMANNALYMKAIEKGEVPFERETLTPAQRYNEYIMTAIRTMWGVDPLKLQIFGPGLVAHFEKAVEPYLASGKVERIEGKYRLSTAGKLLTDHISAHLFVPS